MTTAPSVKLIAGHRRAPILLVRLARTGFDHARPLARAADPAEQARQSRRSYASRYRADAPRQTPRVCQAVLAAMTECQR